MKLQVCNEELELLPEKALYWPRRQTLALSDIHFGKAESYQAAGVPVPSGAHLDDLYHLQNLLNRRDVKRVLILGDFIHNKDSWSPTVRKDLENFLNSFSEISWTLIYGNHERGSVEVLRQLPLTFLEDHLLEEPFQWVHGHEENKKGYFQIQGHIHPQVLLRDGPLSMRLPCFHLTPESLTLPAFGSLTGGFVIRPGKRDRVFAVVNEDVYEIRK